ncbi:MAG: hypothetical protein WA799_00985 [Nitrosotalea sp.]
MALSFDELRFFIVLLFTINIIVIVYAVNYDKNRKKSRIYDISVLPFFVFMFLFFLDLIVGASLADNNLQINQDVKQFILQNETGIIYAFIFCWVSIILLISYSMKSEHKELMWYSLLINHLALILVVISFVVDLIPKSAQLPIPFIQDYTGLIIVMIIGFVMELIHQKSRKMSASTN